MFAIVKRRDRIKSKWEIFVGKFSLCRSNGRMEVQVEGGDWWWRCSLMPHYIPRDGRGGRGAHGQRGVQGNSFKDARLSAPL